MKTFFYNAMMCFFAITLNAQTIPENTYELGAKINEMTLTDGGVLVVATNDGLVGIDPLKNSANFTFNSFGSLKEDETDFIPNTPYIVVSQGGGALTAFTGSKKAVIDYMTGTVLFDSERDNWKQVFTCNVAMPQNKVIISGLQKEGDMAEKNTVKIAVYDLGTGNQDFSFFMFEPGKVSFKNYAVTGTPFMLKNSILIPTSQGVVCKGFDGSDIWSNEVKNLGWLVADETEKEIYGFQTTSNGKNTRIHKFGSSNGNPLWSDDRKVKGIVNNFQILPQGLAVVSDVAPSGGKGLKKLVASKAQSHIGFLSATNGEDLWEKAPKTKGYVQHFYVEDDGILFGIQEGGINKISFDGKTLFKKPLKTGENIQMMARTPQGLIYITSEDANIVNLETGEQVWKKPLKYKRAKSVVSAYDEKNGKYLISAKGVVYSVDENTGDVEELVTYKFKEKEEPTIMQVRSNGIFLGSSQNVANYGFDGSENYYNYYKSPGQSGFVKVLSGALAVASTAMAGSHSFAAGYSQNTLGSYHSVTQRHNKAADMYSAIGTAAFDLMLKRFKASSATENAQFILTNLDGGAGLVKVNKDTGSVEKEILLKNKKPEYKVDEYGGYLFYKNGKTSISTFNLN